MTSRKGSRNDRFTAAKVRAWAAFMIGAGAVIGAAAALVEAFKA